MVGVDVSKFPKIRQRDQDSCVVANAETIVKFFEPSSTWTQEGFWTEIQRAGQQPSFCAIKRILERDVELCKKYDFLVDYAEAQELPSKIRGWLEKNVPVAFSYPVCLPIGRRVQGQNCGHVQKRRN